MTAAFCIPALKKLIRMIMSFKLLFWSRELACQTSQVCKEFGKHLKVQVMVTTGDKYMKTNNGTRRVVK